MSDNFESMLRALEGERVLEKPRVSRETIVSVLREHTDMLREMKLSLSEIAVIAQTLKEQASSNQAAISSLQSAVAKNTSEIKEANVRLLSFRNELEEIKDKVSEIPEIRRVVKEQRGMIDDIKSNFEHFRAHTNDHLANTDRAMEVVEKKTSDTQFETKELRHIVDHFGDNLVLSSTQITVESAAGFSKRPMSLFDILKGCQQTLTGIDSTLAEQKNQLDETIEALGTKADVTVAFTVSAIEKDIAAIQEHIKKEEDQGINAIRRSCENLTVVVESIQSNLLDKVDRNTTELIVQRKYEDIVQYLQEALQASAEDEDNFKNIAADLEENMNKLSNCKADRFEIQPIQESLVRAEAMIAKLEAKIKEKNRGSESYTRQELDSMLENKVDFDVLEEQIAAVLKNRRSKKTALLGGRGGDDEDGVGESGKSLIVKTQILGDDLDIRGKFPGSTKSVKQASPYGNSGFPNNVPGAFRMPSEGTKAGGIPPGPMFPVVVQRPKSSQSQITSAHSELDPRTEGLHMSQSMDQLHGTDPSRVFADHEGAKDYSFLGAATTGGGFNNRSQHKVTSLKVLSPAPVSNQDLEGGGMMVKGMDGHLYYTDDDTNRSSPSPTNNPSYQTAKITQKSRQH